MWSLLIFKNVRAQFLADRAEDDEVILKSHSKCKPWWNRVKPDSQIWFLDKCIWDTLSAIAIVIDSRLDNEEMDPRIGRRFFRIVRR